MAERTASLTSAEVSKLQSLGTSNEDIQKIVRDAAGSKGSEQKLQAVVSLLSERSNRASALSAALRIVSDAMRSIIQNIR